MKCIQVLSDTLDEDLGTLEDSKKLVEALKVVIAEEGLTKASAYSLGRVYYRLRELERALECFSVSDNPMALVQVGDIHFDLEEYQEAKENFVRARQEIDPEPWLELKIAQRVLCCRIHSETATLSADDFLKYARLQLEIEISGESEVWPFPETLAEAICYRWGDLDSSLRELSLALFGVQFIRWDVWPEGGRVLERILQKMLLEHVGVCEFHSDY